MNVARVSRQKWLQIRASEEELSLMDELAAHFEADDRTEMFRMMMRSFRDRMIKDRAKKAKEKPE